MSNKNKGESRYLVEKEGKGLVTKAGYPENISQNPSDSISI